MLALEALTMPDIPSRPCARQRTLVRTLLQSLVPKSENLIKLRVRTLSDFSSVEGHCRGQLDIRLSSPYLPR